MRNRVQRFAVAVAFILAAALGLRAATLELSMNHVFNGVPLTLNSMQYRNAR